MSSDNENKIEIMMVQLLFASKPKSPTTEQMRQALEGDDLEKIRELTLELHAMVHTAEISGRAEKTIADHVLDYIITRNPSGFSKSKISVVSPDRFLQIFPCTSSK